MTKSPHDQDEADCDGSDAAEFNFWSRSTAGSGSLARRYLPSTTSGARLREVNRPMSTQEIHALELSLHSLEIRIVKLEQLVKFGGGLFVLASLVLQVLSLIHGH